MELGLAGKVALVAAGSRGLGRAVAEELATEGMHVGIFARDADVVGEAADHIDTLGPGKVCGTTADLLDPAQLRAAIETIVDALGPVDVLVTNAGGPPAGPFEDHDWDAWQRAVDLNLRTAVELSRAVLPGMRERGWGRILNITSITVKQPVDGLILSNSIRAGVTGFARTLANEVAGQGITVNNLLPGYTRTARLQQLAAKLAGARGVSVEDVERDWIDQIPAARLGEPNELAALAAFLASDRAAYITGQSIPIDGGWIRSLV